MFKKKLPIWAPEQAKQILNDGYRRRNTALPQAELKNAHQKKQAAA
jgi:hypothetical protein